MSTSSGREGYCSRCQHHNDGHTRKSEAKCKKCKKIFEICQVGVHGEVTSYGWRICYVPCSCGKEYYPDKANSAIPLKPHEYAVDHSGYRPLIPPDEEDSSGVFDDSQAEVSGEFESVVQTPYGHTRSKSEDSIDPLTLVSTPRRVVYEHTAKEYSGRERSESEGSMDPLLSPETYHQYTIDSVANLAQDLSNIRIEDSQPVASGSEIGWSKWEWNETYKCNSRYRKIPGTDNYEYDYDKPTAATASSSKYVASGSKIGWSKWEWNETYGCNYRYRQIPGTDDYEYDYEKTTTASPSKHGGGKEKKGKGKRK